jgi:hypothetical protein
MFLDFSHFKPRGRYTEYQMQRNYFKAIMWLSIVKIKLENIEVIWFLANIFCFRYYDEQGNSKATNPVAIFKKGYELIAGKSLIADFQDIYDIGRRMSLSGFILTKAEITSLYEAVLKHNAAVESFKFMEVSDTKQKTTLNVSSFITPVQTPDTWIMLQITSQNPNFPRRQTSFVDLAYSLFNHTNQVDLIRQRIKGTSEDPMKFRDGLDYFGSLESCRKEIQKSMIDEPGKWRSSIFSHWVFLLSKLSWVSNYPLHEKVYTQKAWQDKVMKTQFGSYAELRHDLCLQLEHGTTWAGACSHPEVYVEPNLEFWQEFKNFVQNIGKIMTEMDDLISPNLPDEEVEDEYLRLYGYSYRVSRSENLEHVGRFERRLEDLIEAVKCQMANEPYPNELNLKNIVYWSYDSYLQFVHDGWYLNLIHNMELHKKFNYDPVIADIFTDEPSSVLQNPGSVLHIATKKPRVGAVLIENSVTKINKVFLICAYNPVELYQPFGERLDDLEWGCKLQIEEFPDAEPDSEFVNLESEQIKLFCGGTEEEGVE